MANKHWHVAACAVDVSKFLSDAERCRFAQSCIMVRAVLLSRSIERSGNEERLDKESLMARHASLCDVVTSIGNARSKPGRRAKRTRIDRAQAQQVAWDLVLVACGLRVSSLIDCVRLTSQDVEELMEAIRSLEPSPGSRAFHQLHAVIVQGNVFFIHRERFLTTKSADIASRFCHDVFVDVRHHQPCPMLIDSSTSGADPSSLSFTEDVGLLCQQIAHESVVGRCATEAQVGVSSPATLAGVILCYPVVYVLEPVADEWEEQRNCLGNQRLCLFQCSMREKGRGAAPWQRMLQEFSLPARLDTGSFRINPLHFVHTVSLRNLHQAITFAHATAWIDAHVAISHRTLPLVAL